MRVTEIKYERLANLGARFENLRIGVTILLEDGDDPVEALDKAKRFVNTNLALAGASFESSPDSGNSASGF